MTDDRTIDQSFFWHDSPTVDRFGPLFPSETFPGSGICVAWPCEYVPDPWFPVIYFDLVNDNLSSNRKA